jgi:hypothetical protein
MSLVDAIQIAAEPSYDLSRILRNVGDVFSRLGRYLKTS